LLREKGMIPCPFCQINTSRILLANDLAVAIIDGYPVSPGHSLIIPRRHIASIFEATAAEQAELWEMVVKTRELLQAEHQPDGFNIGINDGEAAGQTVLHLHIHLIPRYAGDITDPRGGVRWVRPEKAPYWK